MELFRRTKEHTLEKSHSNASFATRRLLRHRIFDGISRLNTILRKIRFNEHAFAQVIKCKQCAIMVSQNDVTKGANDCLVNINRSNIYFFFEGRSQISKKARNFEIDPVGRMHNNTPINKNTWTTPLTGMFFFFLMRVFSLSQYFVILMAGEDNITMSELNLSKVRNRNKLNNAHAEFQILQYFCFLSLIFTVC